LDTRHHHFKKHLEFPVEWYMTEAREHELAIHRQKLVATDSLKESEGRLIDGVKLIETAMAKKQKADAVAAREPVMAMLGGKGSSGKKIAMKRS
jgi:hypothetical protein